MSSSNVSAANEFRFNRISLVLFAMMSANFVPQFFMTLTLAILALLILLSGNPWGLLVAFLAVLMGAFTSLYWFVLQGLVEKDFSATRRLLIAVIVLRIIMAISSLAKTSREFSEMLPLFLDQLNLQGTFIMPAVLSLFFFEPALLAFLTYLYWRHEQTERVHYTQETSR